MRTLVLAAGALLVVALAVFLAMARWKSHFILHEIPKRLGVNIQQEANGVTYTQSHGGHTLFKIHASKVVQLKQGGRALLHDVQIELYGEDGNRVDRIVGDEFEYDQKNGRATAAGPVEITLTRPGPALAVVSKPPPARSARTTPLTNAAQKASEGEIHVKTSGLTFDQKSGIATTAERVEFAITQGTGSSVGATFDSEKGQLILDHAVELDVNHGPEKVLLHAQHAEFERENLLCRMLEAHGSFRGGEAAAGEANLLFRPDGSAVRLEASNGFSVTTATAARIAAPRGTLEFDEHNQPRHGRLEGGATMDSSSNGRVVHGMSPTADLTFTPQGLLHHAHLERGVTFHSDEISPIPNGGGESLKVSRDWRSPVGDVDFRNAGKGQVELASVTGTGGVVITGHTQRGGGPSLPSRMLADQVTATFGERQIIKSVVGTGHAALEETSGSGATQSTTGDRIEASLAAGSARIGENGKAPDISASLGSHAGGQIQSATVDGNVVLIQQQASKPGFPPQPPIRATAGRAVYEGTGEWLRLSVNPRVQNGALQLTADQVDVSQGSGDAFARGNVKATWLESPTPRPEAAGKPLSGSGFGSMTMGGQGPAHVVAAEAQVHQSTGEATFRGQARLWQQANSIAAPVIVFDRIRQTLVARATSAAEPVRVVMLSAGSPNPTPRSAKPDDAKATVLKATAPSVIRVRGGDLKYSEAERKAVMHGGAAGTVVAEAGSTISVSNDLELLLLPPGNHAGNDGGPAQVDRMTAHGNVTIRSQGRKGTGQQMVYSSETGQYVLTGTASNPPQLIDPTKGTVTGESLIFNSRDDSVSIEGGGRKATTETVAPK